MGNKSLKKYLYDIQQSIDSIYEYLGNRRDFWDVISRDLPKGEFNLQMQSNPIKNKRQNPVMDFVAHLLILQI